MAALDDAQAFLGSFMSLITESELRYEGYLFYLNTQESTIGLRNVKSYGTEGRRRDGPQILPVNRVFQYLYFRGCDIKSLDVLSTPDVNMTEDLPEDPAIIKDHYPHQSHAFMNMMSTTAVPQLPAPTFQGSLPLTQSVGSSWCWRSSSLPPTRNDWTGYSGSSEQLPPLPKAMLVSPPGKPATVASHILPGHIPYTAPTAIHSSPSVLPGLNENAHVPPVSEKPEPVIGPTLPCQTSSQPGASIAVGSSVFVSNEDGNTGVDVAESSGSGKAQEPEY